MLSACLIIVPRESGGIGRRARLRIWSRKGWGFESPLSHHCPGNRLQGTGKSKNTAYGRRDTGSRQKQGNPMNPGQSATHNEQPTTDNCPMRAAGRGFRARPEPASLPPGTPAR